METNIKNKINLIVSTFLVIITLVACSTDDDESSNNSNTQEIAVANSIATSGSWTVTSYIDDGQNETSDYNGYTFSFQENGTITATNGSTELEGTWSIEDDSNSSSDDVSDDSSDIDFNIFFAVSEDNVFDDLSDDWDIVSVSDTSINLRDVSGGDGSIDLLTFTKI